MGGAKGIILSYTSTIRGGGGGGRVVELKKSSPSLVEEGVGADFQVGPNYNNPGGPDARMGHDEGIFRDLAIHHR